MVSSDETSRSRSIDQTRGRVLLVEDQEPLRRAYGRLLEKAGFEAALASSGEEALAAIVRGDIEVIVSDINMPGMDGIALLRAVREHDLDLPVILVTGYPSIDSAARAIEYGALKYLIKPVEQNAFVESVADAVRLRGVARLKRQAAALLGAGDRLVGDRAGLETTLARGLASLWMAYQPIVNPKTRQVVAFEALVRTHEPALPHPGALFSAAERMGRVHEVGRAIRASVARTLADGVTAADIFLNLHSADLLDEALFAPEAPLTAFARRIVLEITERAALDSTADVPGRIRRLRDLGFRVAIDDLGAGYAGLSYFALLSPDVVKLDMALVRDVHREEVKQKLIGSLTELCGQLGMLVVAEGVETPEERDATIRLGCDLLQGYLFARPGPPFPEVVW
jgi:EAL domain-containing protein (putative c-di-GMP-specific phosphodiesterase class I)/ActR/RegA family two-component response regulator